MNDIITQDGEVIETEVPSNMAVALQKAEIDQAVSTARTYPRSLKRVQASILSMATLDRESAEECMYALPRGGKPIKGPSIRFAEVLKQSFGNCRSAARVVHVDRTEGYVEAEGVFHDLETNAASTARVRRRITDKRGKVFSDDMIIVTGNAACSIAMRNAILAGIPKPLWRNAFEQVQATIVGDVTTLSESRAKAVSAFARYGVTPDQLLEAIGRQSIDDVDVDDLVTMRGMVSAIKNGEATVEEMFGGMAKPKSDHETLKDPLADQVTLPDQTVDETPDPAPASSQGGADSDGAGVSSTPAPSPSTIEMAKRIVKYIGFLAADVPDGFDDKDAAIENLPKGLDPNTPEPEVRKLKAIKGFAMNVINAAAKDGDGYTFQDDCTPEWLEAEATNMLGIDASLLRDDAEKAVA